MDTTVDSDEDGIADNDVDNWFDCYNGDDIAMNLVNDGNEDCSMGEDEHDSEPWMMFDDCTDMSDSSIDGVSMWECFVDMDDDGTLTSEESMGMWYVCEMITMVDGDMWFCEPPHEEDRTEDVLGFYFDAADADGDGMLSSDEFSLMYSIFDMEGADASVMLAVMDSDGDGEVSASEYSDFANATAGVDTLEGNDWEDFEMLIVMWDDDGSGGLSVDELQALYDSGDDDDHDDHGDMVCYDMSTHSVDHSYTTEEDCEDAGLMWTSASSGGDHGDHGDHDGHDMHAVFDWNIRTTDMMMTDGVEGDFADYHIVLSLCMIDEDSMEDGDPGMMMSDPPMTCGDDVMKVSMAEASAPGADITFHDADSSGTISDGDMVHINPEIDAGGDWNTVRLYSASADKYSDENPMLTPGFGALAGIVALLGAALLARRD